MHPARGACFFVDDRASYYELFLVEQQALQNPYIRYFSCDGSRTTLGSIAKLAI